MTTDRSEAHFLQMLATHQRLLHRVCRAYCPEAADRADMFQDIVLQLWRAWPTFRGDAKVSTWLFRVALYTAMAGNRRQRPASAPLDERIQAQPVPEKNDEQVEALYQALYELSDADKAFMLLFLEGYETDEIAALTGTTVNNTRVKLHRIREKIKAIVLKDK